MLEPIVNADPGDESDFRERVMEQIELVYKFEDPLYAELSAPCRCVYPHVCFCKRRANA